MYEGGESEYEAVGASLDADEGTADEGGHGGTADEGATDQEEGEADKDDRAESSSYCGDAI